MGISPLGVVVMVNEKMVNKKRVHHVCSHFKQTWREYKKNAVGIYVIAL